jgi:hypothetical protein
MTHGKCSVSTREHYKDRRSYLKGG